MFIEVAVTKENTAVKLPPSMVTDDSIIAKTV